MEEKKRPLGISILAVLHIIYAIFITFLLVQLAMKLEDQQFLDMLGPPPIVFIVTRCFIWGLAIASGILMWKGKKWGWYLGSFCYMWGILLYAIALATLLMSIISFMPPEEIAIGSQSPTYIFVKHSVQTIIAFLLYLYLYLYFFRSNVREFFSLTEQKKWKPVLAELSICIAIVVVDSITWRFIT